MSDREFIEWFDRALRRGLVVLCLAFGCCVVALAAAHLGRM